jgi:2-methylisocitrate lyase-like PEP mutase family enzyme
MKTIQEKSARFVDLHKGPECFFIPNPFDTGSALILERMGFHAVASTSAGFAFTHGLPDMRVTREMKMAHLREMCAAVSIPVNADLENGYGDLPEDAAETIRQAAKAGAVGGSIEDSTGKGGDQPIYDIGHARDRIVAAVEAARSAGFKFMLTARAENFLWGRKDLADTIKRLQAYQDAGADVLFAPGVSTLEDIRAVTSSVDLPVNVIGAGLPFTREQLQEAGVRRISVGGALARAAYGALEAAAQEMLEKGTHGYTKGLPSTKHFNELFTR